MDTLLHRTQPLCNLYFCDDCLQLRCGRCVSEEITGYYCPNCLFEVPSASVKAEKNRCARNCFECPTCFHCLSVVEDADVPSRPADSGKDGGTENSPHKPFYLQCSYCRWNSREVDLSFEKPTGLANQLQKLERTQVGQQEFDNLRGHLESLLRTTQGNPSLGMGSPHTSSLLSSLRHPLSLGLKLGSPASSTMGYSPARSTSSGIASPFSTRSDAAPLLLSPTGRGDSKSEGGYQALHTQPSQDETTTGILMGLEDQGQISTLAQRSRQLNTPPYLAREHWPQRIALRSKRAKRCRACRHILIKPEQKAQITRFKIKLIAMNFVPNITIVRNPMHYVVNHPFKFVLRFTNPQYHATQVSLAIPDHYPGRAADVTILAPMFKIGAYNDIWEYELGDNSDADDDKSEDDDQGSDELDDALDDVDLDSLGIHAASSQEIIPDYGDGSQLVPQTIPSGSGAIGSAERLKQQRRQRRLLSQGIYSCRGNETAIVCEATPLQPTSTLILPLHVTFNYFIEGLSDDELSDAPESQKPGQGERGLAPSAKEPQVTDQRECSFWVYINLGEAQALAP
ncbi:hypothetical protein IWQ61_010059 [Dispira simplex]|nr:hypothetical protein IWQ61_010059 [Dispira simplex]